MSEAAPAPEEVAETFMSRANLNIGPRRVTLEEKLRRERDIAREEGS